MQSQFAACHHSQHTAGLSSRPRRQHCDRSRFLDPLGICSSIGGVGGDAILANRTRFLQAYLDRSQSWVDPGSTGSSSAPSYDAYGHHNYAMTVRIKPDETSVELVRHQHLQSMSQHVTALCTSPCGSSFGTLVYAIEIGIAHDSFRVYL